MRDKIALAITKLDDEQMRFINSLGLALVDSISNNDLSQKFYFLKKKDGTNFKDYSDRTISILRKHFFKVLLPYKDKACLSNKITIKLNQILSEKNLEKKLKQHGIIGIYTITQKGSNPYKYKIYFNDSLGYGVIDEFNKLCRFTFIENVYPSISRLIDSD